MGIGIIQCSQIITIIGGPAGYLLTLNSYITEVVEGKARTGVLGQLSGCAMLGMSFGYLVGGLLSDTFGISAPFRVTLMLFLLSCFYVTIFLPWISPNKEAEKKTSKDFARFFGPLKMFAPQKWVLTNGRIQNEWGTLLLGTGVFLGVLATSYVPILLQMYSTDILEFSTSQNGYLISLNSLIRGLFLTLAFPRVISAGRAWLDRRHGVKKTDNSSEEAPATEVEAAPPEYPGQDDIAVEAMGSEEEPREQPKADEKETFHFDLMFTKYSLIADGLITGLGTFVTHGWQIFAIAFLLPFASGTGPAAKGTILQMCPASQRSDALSAITLLEMIARLTTSKL